MSKYCVYSGRDCEILPSTEKEIWDEAYQQGLKDGIASVKDLGKMYSEIRAEALDEFIKEIDYLLNCGMGKKKALNHLKKIAEKKVGEEEWKHI